MVLVFVPGTVGVPGALLTWLIVLTTPPAVLAKAVILLNKLLKKLDESDDETACPVVGSTVSFSVGLLVGSYDVS